MFPRFIVSLLCLLTSSTAFATDNTVLQQARERLAHGDGLAAVQMLLPLEGQVAGEPQYDLLLAQAYLQSKQAHIALFVLERVVFSHPSLPQARLLMAKAYIQLGDDKQAEQVLQVLVQQGGLDIEDRHQAMQMLEQIRDHTKHSQLSAYLGFGVGHDSNANAATADTSFLGYNLSSNSIAKASSTSVVNAGARSLYTLANQDRLFTAVDWARNAYPQADFVNNDILGFQLGWQKAERYVLAYQSQAVNLNGAFNNRGNHIYGLLQTDSSWRWQPFFRLGEVRFSGSSSIQDVTQAIIGTQFSLSHWIHGTGMSILLAEDSAIKAGSPYGRRYAAWQIHNETRFLKRMSLGASAGATYSQYQGTFYGIKRRERQASLGLNLNYRAARHWDFGLYAAYTDSWSTVALYQYDRLTTGLTIRRNFVR